MASKSPFHLEDQTDEDFFDKLVDDDFEPTTMSSSSAAVTKLADGNESDDARAFSNLSIEEDLGGENSLHEEKPMDDLSGVDSLVKPSANADCNSDPASFQPNESNVEGFDVINHVRELKNEVSGLKEEAVPISDSAAASISGSGGFGVKEVGWSSFYADPPENVGHGLESYSDFFSELGNSNGDLPPEVENNVNYGMYIASGNAQTEALCSVDSVNHGQYLQSQVSNGSVDQSASGLNLNSSEYWENMYPGWKYDEATGQWCQVHDHDQSVGTQWSNDISATDSGGVSDGPTDAAYLRQGSQPVMETVAGSQSVVETVAETSTMESVSSWSQVSQVNNGYPEHMVFDPQYPGWYYDITTQEWRSLESYNLAAQLTDQVHEQQNQNGYASSSAYSSNIGSGMFGEKGQNGKHSSGDIGGRGQHGSWAKSYVGYHAQGSDMWESETVDKTETLSTSAALPNFGGNEQVESFYSSKGSLHNLADQQMSPVQSYNYASQSYVEANGVTGVQSLFSDVSFNQHFDAASVRQNGQMSFSNDFVGRQQPVNVTQQSFQSNQLFPCAPDVGRSPDGCPLHALVTFGFGGKLIVMKDHGHNQNSSFGSQAPGGSSISVLNLMEVVSGNSNAANIGGGTSDYLSALCQQSFPGPLAGGNVGSKDLYKWIDERITNCESAGTDYRKGELLKLLLSLLKIACQHYGNLRSSFGTNTTLRESDAPESAVAKLFASAKKRGMQYGSNGALSHCLQHMPSEEQLRGTASEVQNLLVSGRKMEALQYAQEGQLWGPALVIASQLGEQFYVDTVKQMALRQLVAGTPLRTLCLLIAGQPAEVFSSNSTSDNGLSASRIMSQHHGQVGSTSTLDDWEENLAVMTANRTKDDELVIINLGDCLWKERSEIVAAHICYLVAETNFEPYSDAARLCLIGADHWKFPRTYASPEAIQRTELYEYSRVLGNSQYILLPFQPYKLIYAYMLAEVGKLSDALKYCQAVSKSLKTGRAPEVEVWKPLVSSLEERIRIHQQGGYTNLAPAKLVGKLLNFFDSTAHRVVGSLPPPAPMISQGNLQDNGHHNQQVAPRVSSSQSTMNMSSLMSSASMEPMTISAQAADGSRMAVHNRSVSEPDFFRTPRQDQVEPSKEETSRGEQGKESGPGASRFGRFGFGSQLLQKTVGLVLRPKPSRQAKLGETNKFYYDEKLKRWVEEGAEPPAEEAALPPPPTTAAFPNSMSDFGTKSATRNGMSPAGGIPSFSSRTADNSSGIPPIPSSTNQFSARGRMGVRARYVDTFNQGRANSVSSFQSPSVPSVKPPVSANAKFFIPTAAPQEEQGTHSATESFQEENSPAEDPSTSITNQSFQTPTSPAMTMQRFPSMGHITRSGSMINPNGPHIPQSRRTASWSGSFNGSTFTTPEKSEGKPLGEVLGMPPSQYMPSPTNSDGFANDLQEVEL